MNYNELMKNLDSCLGLEKASMESAQRTAKPSGKSAFEGYDDIEKEIAMEMGISPAKENDEDLVFLDGEETSEPVEETEGQEEIDEREDLKTRLTDYFNRLVEESSREEAKVSIGNLVDEVFGPDEEEAENEPEEEPVEENCEEEPATEGSLTDKLLALGHEKAEEGVEVAPKEQESVGDIADSSDPDAAFEALSAKMLSRYSSLAGKTNKTNSATEGQSATEVVIDEDALRRTSCEFNYSGHHLRRMVTEAIKKGVI